MCNHSKSIPGGSLVSLIVAMVADFWTRYTLPRKLYQDKSHPKTCAESRLRTEQKPFGISKGFSVLLAIFRTSSLRG